MMFCRSLVSRSLDAHRAVGSRREDGRGAGDGWSVASDDFGLHR